MATEKVTENLVKFAYGTKANYDVTKYADFVYFATDTPEMHAQGMWHGVSGVSLNGNTLTITCGTKNNIDGTSTYQTVTASLAAIACTATQRANWTTAYNFVNSIMGTDQDSVINKWQEVVDFLAGIQDITLTEIMDTKADKATKVFGYNGIKITKTNAEGSVQEGDATLGSSFQVSIDNQMRGGTYTKVQVNDAGLVTVGQSLVESDIPTLSIGKISGLQAALNDKVSGANQIYTEAPLSISGEGMLKNEPTISLLFDNATLVLGSDGKLKVGTISASQVTGLSNGYVPNTRQVIAGNGLTGGGALSADVTLSVKANGSTINVSSSGISVASAPKLSTARTLWGNSFDGSRSVSGDLTFVADGLTSQASHGMRIGSTYGGFIGFSKVIGMGQPDGSIAGGFTGISLGWGANPETDAASVRINDSIFTYKGNPIYYKGSTDFTDGVRAVIAPELTDIANDFLAIGNRVTAVEKQLKWIEVS